MIYVVQKRDDNYLIFKKNYHIFQSHQSQHLFFLDILSVQWVQS